VIVVERRGPLKTEDSGTAVSGEKSGKPNIVFILADDLGWGDVGYHDDEIETPNIDRIAREGIELDRFYVCPICSPTRAGLMTGRYPIRFGLMRAVIPPWCTYGLPTDEAMLPAVLAKAGYTHRGIFGKWHLGHSSLKYTPLRRGFTEFYGHYNGAIDYFTHQREGELDWHLDERANHDAGYSTDLIAEKAAAFIQTHAGDGPFFCYVPFNAPHSPYQAKQADIDKYAHLAEKAENRHIHAAMVSALDDGVGRILSAIDQAGIARDTMVWFVSDNGGGPLASSNGPLRGRKASVFEGGIRVPAVVRWPAAIAAGSKTDAPLAYIDVLPTLMRIAGVQDHGGKPLDGLDVSDVLTGKHPTLARDIFSYCGQAGEDRERISLTTPEWKLIVTGPNIADENAPQSQRRAMLFRFPEDLLETHDVAADHPQIVQELYAKAKQFRALQPADGVPPYSQGKASFQAPKEWQIQH